MLSAMSLCPDLPTALLACEGKCTQRLRPRLGGEGQLTSKALLQKPVSPGEIPAGAVPKYHTHISGAQQSTSNIYTEHKLDFTVPGLLWTVLGSLGSHSPASCSSLQLFLLLAWEAPSSVHASPCFFCQGHCREHHQKCCPLQRANGLPHLF